MLCRLVDLSVVLKTGLISVQFSSVQFAKINMVLSAKALQDHDTVIDAVVAGKEMSSGVAGMRTKMVRR